jgi:hypothetical protein
MSPDEMSDDRIREAIEYYGQDCFRQSSYHQRQFDNFTALLAEREAQRVADVEEVFAAVLVEESGLVTA